MFEELTADKKPDFHRLTLYGFLPCAEGTFQYQIPIRNGEFELTVRINSNGNIYTELTDPVTGDPYELYKTTAQGKFVGEIRQIIAQVIADISDKCFETSLFKSRQTHRVIDFVYRNYHQELEFLWPKFPGNGIWRRNDNNKWFGLVLTVDAEKIGLNLQEKIEILDLRMDPGEARLVLAQKGCYPGWHMNKKSWYTMVLNDSVPDNILEQRISQSFLLAGNINPGPFAV
ncbi:MAG: MmcQ/YjbR family DNA-binding protein [Succinivibrionaceae bacterium]